MRTAFLLVLISLVPACTALRDINADGGVPPDARTDSGSADTSTADADPGDGGADSGRADTSVSEDSARPDAGGDSCVTANELCDGVDNDCDPSTLDGAGDPRVGAPCDGPDADQCPEGTSTCAGGAIACSDVSTDTPETCLGATRGDEDCDGAIDEAGARGEMTFYADADGDGYGLDSGAVMACTMSAGSARSGGDCDDSDLMVFPSAPETCDADDEDCDGHIDEGTCTTVGCQRRELPTGTYLFCTMNRPWDMARAHCMMFGYDLAILDDMTEHDAVWNQARLFTGALDDWFIGFRRAGGVTMWVDGSPIGYSNFGAPLGAGECGEMEGQMGGAWDYDPCTSDQFFICEAPP